MRRLVVFRIVTNSHTRILKEPFEQRQYVSITLEGHKVMVKSRNFGSPARQRKRGIMQLLRVFDHLEWSYVKWRLRLYKDHSSMHFTCLVALRQAWTAAHQAFWRMIPGIIFFLLVWVKYQPVSVNFMQAQEVSLLGHYMYLLRAIVLTNGHSDSWFYRSRTILCVEDFALYNCTAGDDPKIIMLFCR